MGDPTHLDVRRTRRGAAAIEAAIAIPVLALLLFFIVDQGVRLSDQIDLNGAVNETVRLAASDRLPSNRSCPEATTIVNDHVARAVCHLHDLTGADTSELRIWLSVRSRAGVNVGSDVDGALLTLCAAAVTPAGVGPISADGADMSIASYPVLDDLAPVIPAGGEGHAAFAAAPWTECPGAT